MTFTKLFILVLVHLCTCSPHYSPETRIIGGEEAAAHSVKSMVFLAIQTKQGDIEGCGGTLLSSKQHVLTAAHCVDGGRKVLGVVLGAHNVDPDETEAHRVRVSADKSVAHSGFDRSTGANDIAIIKLKQQVQLDSGYIDTVTLESKSSASNNYNNQMSTAYGWGLLAKDSRVEETDVLHKVSVKISTLSCANVPISPKSKILCTSGNGKKGTCNGDSGGPLFVGNVQVGVISAGQTRYCERSLPSIYTRVASYRDWIDQTVASM